MHIQKKRHAENIVEEVRQRQSPLPLKHGAGRTRGTLYPERYAVCGRMRLRSILISAVRVRELRLACICTGKITLRNYIALFGLKRGIFSFLKTYRNV